MLNLQLDQFLYGLLGLPEQITLFDADDAALKTSAEHLAKLHFTGQDLLNVLTDWIDEVAYVNDVPDQDLQINSLTQRLERLDNMVSDITTPDTGEFKVDDLFDEEYEEQVPPDKTDELTDEYITVDNVVSDEDAEEAEEVEEEPETDSEPQDADNVEDTGGDGEDISIEDVTGDFSEEPSKDDLNDDVPDEEEKAKKGKEEL